MVRTAAEPKYENWKRNIPSTRKNKQAPLGKLLPELAKPWSRLQLHKKKGKLTKRRNQRPHGCKNKIAGTEENS
jgi:hypothetical protein